MQKSPIHQQTRQHRTRAPCGASAAASRAPRLPPPSAQPATLCACCWGPGPPRGGAARRVGCCSRGGRAAARGGSGRQQAQSEQGPSNLPGGSRTPFSTMSAARSMSLNRLAACGEGSTSGCTCIRGRGCRMWATEAGMEADQRVAAAVVQQQHSAKAQARQQRPQRQVHLKREAAESRLNICSGGSRRQAQHLHRVCEGPVRAHGRCCRRLNSTGVRSPARCRGPTRRAKRQQSGGGDVQLRPVCGRRLCPQSQLLETPHERALAAWGLAWRRAGGRRQAALAGYTLRQSGAWMIDARARRRRQASAAAAGPALCRTGCTIAVLCVELRTSQRSGPLLQRAEPLSRGSAPS